MSDYIERKIRRNRAKIKAKRIREDLNNNNLIGGPAMQLADLLEKGYPVEEAIKKIEKDFGFFVDGWLDAAKKMLENRKGLKEEKINVECR